MSSFFRKLRWLTERRNKEAELRDELDPDRVFASAFHTRTLGA